jgi:hypothetical protein
LLFAAVGDIVDTVDAGRGSTVFTFTWKGFSSLTVRLKSS